MKITTLRTTLIILYILLISITTIYVYNVLAEGTIEVEPKKSSSNEKEVKPVKVNLVVNDGITTTSNRYEMKNVSTVIDLMEKSHEQQELFFEKTIYVDKVVFDQINKKKAPDGYEWHVFNNGEDITQGVSNIFLVDEQTYEIKLIRVNK